MNAFSLVAGELHAEGLPLSVIAERFGTPCYVYSRAALEAGFRAFDAAFEGVPHLVCYAVKANSNLAVLNILARLGSGFDIVSGGELFRVLRAGADPSGVVFAGVGKTPEEIRAAIRAGSPPAAMTRASSPPETMSNPLPRRARMFSTARLEFALTA